MTSCEISPDLPEHVDTSLPRIQSTLNNPNLHERRRTKRDARTGSPISFLDVSRSEENESDTNQILYMAELNRRPNLSRSMSSLCDSLDRDLDGPTDCKLELKEDLEVAWSIIDREICEWQYVCETGRPYWWSPEAKFTRIKRMQMQPRLINDTITRIWTKQAEDSPNQEYADRRRVVAEAFMTNPSDIEDVAQLVAVQLLGACFTLPLDHGIGAPSPNYTNLAKYGSHKVPHPRLISSLRMHTHFRYSPCSGNQARSPSPVQLWPGAYDGQPPSPSGQPMQDIGSLPSTRPANSSSMLKNVHQERLQPEDELNVNESTDLAATGLPQNFVDQNAAIKRGFTCPVFEGADSDPASKCWISGNVNGTLQIVGRPKRTRPTETQDSSGEEASDGEQYTRSHQSLSSRTKYRLHSVIRSEPHHVFIQPVKELVVKRWKKLRGRVSESLYNSLPRTLSEDQKSASASNTSGMPSPAIDFDEKQDKMQTREISIPKRMNPKIRPRLSPVLGCLQEGIKKSSPLSSPFWADSTATSSKSKHSDNLAAAAALTVADSRLAANVRRLATSEGAFSTSVIDFAFNDNRRFSSQSRALATCGSNHSETSTPLIPSMRTSSRSQNMTQSTKRKGNIGERRRTTLSEVYTTDPIMGSGFPQQYCCSMPVERNILSLAGSRLASPVSEVPPQGPDQEMWSETETIQRSPSESNFLNGSDLQDGSLELKRRPKLKRRNSTGTQTCWSGSDGIEIDGLPPGPEQETWSGKGKEKERTYL